MAAFASSNLGDVSPNTRGPKCEFSGENCSAQYTCPGKNEMCFASGPGENMYESTKIIAYKLFNESMVSEINIATFYLYILDQLLLIYYKKKTRELLYMMCEFTHKFTHLKAKRIAKTMQSNK